MKVFNYHPEYKHFCQESDADESPLEPGAFLIPAHATNIQPPACGSNQIQIFNGTSWSIVEDQRGIYHSTETQQIITNCNPLEAPDNATKEAPPEVPNGDSLIWRGSWVLEKYPAPPVLTPLEKLSAVGLTIKELKELLGIQTKVK